MVKKIIIGFFILLICIQFIQAPKNISGDIKNDIATKYPMPDTVKLIFNKACADCHSNKTNYPWYASIQPVAYWLNDHIVDGKRHFNINEFASYRIGKQHKKLVECMDEVKEGEMPLSSYTLVHKEARLTAAEKAIILNWCQRILDTIETNYPSDSLKTKGPEKNTQSK